MDRSGVLRRRPVLIAVAVVASGVAVWLAFGWFGVQQLVLDDEVDEAPPTFRADLRDAQPAATPATQTALAGSFVDRSHPTRGTATVLTAGSERVLRLEDFATDNGPDLNVYLSSAPPDAPAGAFDDDYVDLGDLKGNVGAQNYVVPAAVDLARYRTVVVWCVRFSVAFGVAPLA